MFNKILSFRYISAKKALRHNPYPIKNICWISSFKCRLRAYPIQNLRRFDIYLVQRRLSLADKTILNDKGISKNKPLINILKVTMKVCQRFNNVLNIIGLIRYTCSHTLIYYLYKKEKYGFILVMQIEFG